MTSLRIGGARVSSGDRLLLGGVVLVVAIVAAWAAMVLRSSDTSGPRSLGDFEAFARMIDAPGERGFASVAAIEAVLPFPILLPSEVEAERIMAVAYLRPSWRAEPAGVDSNYLVVRFMSERSVFLHEYRGSMSVRELFRPGDVNIRPAEYRPLSTSSLSTVHGPATVTELPAEDGGTLLVLEWGMCDHSLALTSLASEFNLDTLIRIAESVPEACE